jgi:ribose/xylose/arabinose/galactoside ABC-type transport system permease subunit
LTTLAPAAAPRTTTRLGRAFMARGELSSVLALVVSVAIFSLATDGFFSISNLRGTLVDITVILIVALGMNLIMLAGEIDVSVGSILAVCAVSAGLLAAETQSLWLPLGLAVAVGTVAGAVNAVLVTKVRVPSIVVTLGTLFIFRGVSLIIARGREVVSVPADIRRLSTESFLGIPIFAWTVIGFVVVVALLRANLTPLRDIPAIGSNRRAAQVAGVRVEGGIALAFILTGTLTGFAAILYLSLVGGAQTIVGTNLELQVIAACAIGGTSIQGGRGSNLSPILGALLIGVLTNGILFVGVSGVWIQSTYGAAILLAVSSDRLRSRYLERAV